MSSFVWYDELDLSPLRAEWAEARDTAFDAELTVTWLKQICRLDVVYCDLATPRRLTATMARATGHAGPILVVSKYLSSEAFMRLQEAGMSGVDRSGNCHLEVPGLFLVSRTGHPNRFPANTGIRNPFAGRTGLVAMTLMDHPTGLRPGGLVREISKLTPISAATVSKALNALEEAELIVRSREEILVVNRERLLDAIADHYPQPVITRRVRGRLRFDGSIELQLRTNAKKNGVLWGVESTMPWVAYPGADFSTHIWTTNIDRLIDRLPFEIDHPFADVVMTETPNVELFLGVAPRMTHESLSPLALYLILGKRDQRARDAAAALRPVILEHSMV